MAADIHALEKRLRAVADAVQVPTAPPAPQVVVMPAAPHSWLFTIARGPDGAIVSVLAEPV